MKNIQSKNLIINLASSQDSNAGGLLGSVSTFFENNRVSLDQIHYDQLQINQQGLLTFTGGIGKCSSSDASVKNSNISGRAVIQSAQSESRSGKVSTCTTIREQNNQTSNFVIQ